MHSSFCVQRRFPVLLPQKKKKRKKEKSAKLKNHTNMFVILQAKNSEKAKKYISTQEVGKEVSRAEVNRDTMTNNDKHL